MIAGTKDKKKKKEPELKLIHEQPSRRALGSVHVKLNDLLRGKDQIEEECVLGIQYSDHSIRTAVTQGKVGH